MSGFGHFRARADGAFLDGWGAGPYTLRVGKRRYYFTDSDMFGPYLENKDGSECKRQPVSEKHPFWAPYHMWRGAGRPGKKVGRWIVCRWRAPRPGTYWLDERGLMQGAVDPEWEGLGYVRIAKPDEATP